MKQWGVIVTSRNGRESWLRHTGGTVVRFRTRKAAEDKAEFLSIGLSDGDVALVVSIAQEKAPRKKAHG